MVEKRYTILYTLIDPIILHEDKLRVKSKNLMSDIYNWILYRFFSVKRIQLYIKRDPLSALSALRIFQRNPLLRDPSKYFLLLQNKIFKCIKNNLKKSSLIFGS